jgi:hypothetical protein
VGKLISFSGKNGKEKRRDDVDACAGAIDHSGLEILIGWRN